MPGANGIQQIDPSGVALTAVMAEHTPILAAILAAVRSDVLELGVGDVKYRQLVLDQFPTAGSKRVLAYRTGAGFDAAAVTTGTISAPINGLLLPANEARLGGQIVNSGAAPVILYLTDRPVPVPGVPALYLAASGGSWDFRLGNLLWCGNVSAVGQGGASTVTVAEI